MPTPAAQLALVSRNNSLTNTQLALKLELATDMRGIQALEETLSANTIIENHIEADTDSQEFINHIGDVLIVLLEEQMKEKNNSA